MRILRRSNNDKGKNAVKIIIKNGKIVDPYSKNLELRDIYIDSEMICAPFSPDHATKIIDASSKHVIPGLTDLHVHFRDPGQTYKEDILSGSMAAARGGFTTVCCMPNTSPPIDSAETLSYVDKMGKETGCIDLFAASAMTKCQKGLELCDFKNLDKTHTLASKLTSHGICGISEDGISLSDKELMEKVCITARDMDLLIMEHAEPEIQMIFRDIELAKKYGCKIHIQHISKAESINMIREAKKDGIFITCEATPHHFALDRTAVTVYGTNAKMNPPLGHSSDRAAVLEGIVDDTIDIIATDHAPHSEAEKNVPFPEAANGIVGLETSFPVSYTCLVKSGLLSLNKLIYKMSTLPLELIGAKPHGFLQGNRPNMAIVDTEQLYLIDKNHFLSKGKNTPFHDMDVYGRIETTIYNGKISWEPNNECNQ